MSQIKEFLSKRTKQDVAESILKLSNAEKIKLNKIDSILFSESLKRRVRDLCEGRELPPDSVNVIVNFFLSDPSSVDNKYALLDALEDGLLTHISPGKYKGVIDMINISKIRNKSLAIRFAKEVEALKHPKSGQGSTGTGIGEVLLALLNPSGKIPKTGGDVEIFGEQIEVKAKNGAIYEFASRTQDQIIAHLKATLDDKFAWNISKNPSLANFLEAIGEYRDLKGASENVNIRKSLIKFYQDRVNTAKAKKAVPVAINNINLNAALNSKGAKVMQEAFGKVFLGVYQEESGWDKIVAFKESKELHKTLIVVATPQDQSNIHYTGLGMSNGNRPAALIINPK